jgi:hypothetical protein
VAGHYGLVFVLSRNLNSSRRRVSPVEARREMVDQVRQGRTITDSLLFVGRSRSWYDGQRRDEPDFAVLIDSVRLRKTDLVDANKSSNIGFSEFSEKYLHAKVWPHMRNVVDLLEGKPPEWIVDGMAYEPGSAGLSRLLVNVPPNHAKSMTVTINYVTYRVALDPTINVMIISKTQEQAKKFLYGIKQRLTHPQYSDLQNAFGPADGYKATSDQWAANKIYLGGSETSGEKDPTIEAVGMGGQIYGSRASLIVLDDVVTLSNATEWPKQQDWIRQEVASRLPPGGGQLLIVGTRVAPVDLYRELRNTEHYTDRVVPWTYLAMPAVLNYAKDPKDWETLWPMSEMPLTEADTPDDDGNFQRWTGPRLNSVRNEVGPGKWSLVYQNLDVAEDAIFDPVCVRGAINGMRKPGALVSGATGHPADSQNFYRVIGIDPAMSGETATVAYAVDRRTQKRYVMDVNIMKAPTPAAIRNIIKEWSEAYKPHTVIVESNAFQLFLTKDEEIRNHLASKGIGYRPHFTGNNKQDPEFGVASLAPLFGSKEKREGQETFKFARDNLLELPDSSTNEHVKKLVEQLITWQPGVRGSKLKMDAVMALWFCEIVARETLNNSTNFTSFMHSEFTAQRDVDQRYTINLDELAAVQQHSVSF